MSGAVEHGGAHGVGKQGGPDRTEFAAVAVPQIADLFLAERLTDGVHVPRRVVRPEMREDVLPDAFDAALGKRSRQLDEGLTLGIVVGRDVARRVEAVVVAVTEAIDRTATHPRAAWVPRHDVEALDQRVLEPAAHTRRHETRREAGTAVVREQHAGPPLRGRPVTSHPEVDRLTLRIVVVERDRDPAAVDTGAEVLELDGVLPRRGHRRRRGNRLGRRGLFGGRRRIGGVLRRHPRGDRRARRWGRFGVPTRSGTCDERHRERNHCHPTNTHRARVRAVGRRTPASPAIGRPRRSTAQVATARPSVAPCGCLLTT